MAKCPNCKNRLPFLEVFSLNAKQHILECKKCGTFLVANLAYTRLALVAFGFAGIACMRVAKILKVSNYNLSIFLEVLGIAMFICGLYFFLTKMRLSKYDGEKKSILSVQSEVTNHEKQDDFEQRKNHFRKLYLTKPDRELKLIATEKGWQPEAQQAALEILEERQK